MLNNARILTTYDNEQVELVFNESFLCPEKSNILDIHFGPEISNWKFRLVFVEEDKEIGKPYQTTTEYGVDGFDAKLTFHKWVSDSFVELKKPAVFKSKDGKVKLFFKLRNESKESSATFHKVHISIWKAI